jgi:hypothetical protein
MSTGAKRAVGEERGSGGEIRPPNRRINSPFRARSLTWVNARRRPLTWDSRVQQFIVPALALHQMQLASGALDIIKGRLSRLTGDPRILALLVAWFFALFMEGAVGFGTAAALAAPFLVAAGFPPIQAVVLTLIGHAAGVSFGAVGTPILPQAAATGFTPLQLSLGHLRLPRAPGNHPGGCDRVPGREVAGPR